MKNIWFSFWVRQGYELECAARRFPKFFGGSLADTLIESIDIAPNQDIAIGGKSYDTSFVLQSGQSYVALLPSASFSFKWAKQISVINQELVRLVFHPNAPYIVMYYTLEFTVVVINIADGTLHRSAKDNTNFFKNGGDFQIPYFNGNKILCFGIQTQYYQATILNFDILDNSLSFTNLNSIYFTDFAMATFSAEVGNQGEFFMGGETSIYGPEAYSTFIRSNGYSVTWAFRNNDPDSGSFNAKRMTVPPTGTTTLFACGIKWATAENGLVIFRFLMDPITHQLTNRKEYSYIDQDNSHPCIGMKSFADDNLLLMSHDKVLVRSFILKITFNSDFSLTYNRIYLNDATFQQIQPQSAVIYSLTKYYLVGNIKSISSCVSSPVQVGFIMSQDESESCILLDTAVKMTETLQPKTNVNWVSIGKTISTYPFSLSKNTITVTNIIGNSESVKSQCCNYDVQITAIPDQIYIIDYTSKEIQVDPFSLINSQCTDMYFTYSFKQNSGPKPSIDFMQFDATNIKFTIQTQLSKYKGQYNISLVSTMNNNQVNESSFILTLFSTEGSNLVASEISDIEYIVSSSQIRVTFPAFVTSTTYKIIYFMTTQDYKGYDQNFITFTNASDNLYYDIFTNDNTKVGSYKMSIIGKFTNNTETQEWANFTVKILDKCYLTKVIPSIVYDMVYYAEDSILYQQFNPFTETLGVCGPITYSREVIGYTPPFPSFILLIENQRKIQVFTADYSNIKMFQVKLYGYAKSSVSNSSAFTIFNIFIKCKVHSLYSDDPVTYLQFTIGQLMPLASAFAAFIQEPSQCNYPIMYTAYEDKKNKIPSFGYFININIAIFVNTMNDQDVGKYKIVIQGEIAEGNFTVKAYHNFLLEIKSRKPTKSEMNMEIPDVKISMNSDNIKSYTYPEALTGGSNKIILYLDQDHKGYKDSDFIKETLQGFIFQPTGKHVGLHHILTSAQFFRKFDDNNCNYCGVPLKINLNIYLTVDLDQRVVEVTQNTTSTTKTQKLEARIKTINQFGKALIEFSQEMIIPANYSNFNDSIISIYIPMTASKQPLLSYWNATNFQGRTLTVQLEFDSPLMVSQSVKSFISYNSNFQGYDTLYARFILPDFFISQNTQYQIPRKYEINKKIPRQIDPADAKLLNSLKDTLVGILTGQIFGNAAMNMIFQAGIQNLWGMINSLQLILVLPLIDVNIPANAQIVFLAMTNIFNFKIIDFSFIDDKIFQYDQSEPLNFQFEQYDIFQKINAFDTYLTQDLFFRKINRGLSIITKLKDYLYFNVMIRLFIEGSIQYSICCVLNIRNPIISNYSDGFSLIFSIFILISLFFLVLFNLTFILPKIRYQVRTKQLSQQQFNSNDLLQRFSSLYKGLKTNSNLALNYYTIFLTRRIMIAFTLILLTEFPVIQTFIQLLLSLLNLCYLILIQPHESKLSNRLEIFNEVCVLVVIYLFFLFTNYYDFPETEYQIGWFLVALALLQILINTLAIMYETLLSIKSYCKQRCRKQAQKHQADTNAVQYFDKSFKHEKINLTPQNQPSLSELDFLKIEKFKGQTLSQEFEKQKQRKTKSHSRVKASINQNKARRNVKPNSELGMDSYLNGESNQLENTGPLMKEDILENTQDLQDQFQKGKKQRHLNDSQGLSLLNENPKKQQNQVKHQWSLNIPGLSDKADVNIIKNNEYLGQKYNLDRRNTDDLQTPTLNNEQSFNTYDDSDFLAYDDTVLNKLNEVQEKEKYQQK